MGTPSGTPPAPKETSIQVRIAIIGLIGTLGVAIVANYDKLRSRPANGNVGLTNVNGKARPEDLLQEELRPIYFDRNGKVLTPENMAILDRYAMLIKQSDSHVVIEGHTSEVDPLSNRNVSDNAGDSVRMYLLRKGVETSRLDVVSFGAEQPLKNANSQYNTRISFRVTDQKR